MPRPFICIILFCIAIATDAPAATFAKDVAPIIFSRCAGCHHPGEAAPFSLLTYADVRKRAAQIVEVTQKRIMPPWLPAAGHGDFIGARRLTDVELQTLKAWAGAGAPLGDAPLPPAPVFTEGWQIGQPDLILESPEYTLEPQGRDVFRNFVVPITIDSPKWIRAIELRPTNPRVTHHARLGVDTSNESLRRDAQDPAPGYAGMAWAHDPDGQLVIWAPGLLAHAGAPDVAWRLHPKTALVLHTHLQPSGKKETVQFRIGLHFSKDAPRQHPAILRIGGCGIDIPAGVKAHTVTDTYTLPIDADIHTIFPHAHSLCTQLSVIAHRPDGTKEPLLSIDHFDEHWHDLYRYQKPVRLAKGSRLISTFVYDNSAENLRNRNQPPRRTVYGSNAIDEMADIYLQVTPVHADQRAVLMEHYRNYESRAQITGHRKTLELYPDNPWNLEALATAYVSLNQPKSAIPLLEKRIQTGPREVFPLAALGMTHIAAGDFAQAQTRLREALALDDQYPLAWLGLGKCLDAQKKSTRPEPVEWADAEAAFRRAIDLAPGLIDAHLALADILLRQNDLAQAKELCELALAASPDTANIHLKLAEITARQKDFDASLKHCETAHRLAPYTHPPKVLLAVNCFALGEQDRAMTLLKEARAQSPEHPVPPLILGQLARRKSQLPDSRHHLDTAAKLPLPDNWPASHRQRFLVLLHSERLQLAQQQQDKQLARDALEQWMKAEPENAKLRQMYDSLPGK